MAINQSVNLILCQYLSVFNLIGRGVYLVILLSDKNF